MQLTGKRAELVKRALLCYVSHNIAHKFVGGKTALEAKQNVRESLALIQDIKLAQKCELIADDIEDINFDDVSFDEMKVKPVFKS